MVRLGAGVFHCGTDLRKPAIESVLAANAGKNQQTIKMLVPLSSKLVLASLGYMYKTGLKSPTPQTESKTPWTL